MRIALYTSGDKPRDLVLAQALHDGGHDVHQFGVSRVRDGFDLHAPVGVDAASIVRELEGQGRPYLLFDKAYNRDFPKWWRVSWRSYQPVDFLLRSACSTDRAEAQGWLARLEPWRGWSPSGHVLLAGGSPKYHAYHDLADPTEYARDLVEYMRTLTNRPIVYRPKPTWRDAVAVPGASFSHSPVKVKGHRIQVDLEGAHCTVTHGSSACFESVLAGVPTIVLGGAATRPISSTSLADIDSPRVVSDEARVQFVANLAYCQWSLEEFRSGEAWRFMEREFICG